MFLVCVVSWPLSNWIVLFRNLAEVVWLAPNHVSCPLLFCIQFSRLVSPCVLVLYMSQLGLHWKNLLIIGTVKVSSISYSTNLTMFLAEWLIIQQFATYLLRWFPVYFHGICVTLTLNNVCTSLPPWIWAGSWQKKFFRSNTVLWLDQERQAQSLHCFDGISTFGALVLYYYRIFWGYHHFSEEPRPGFFIGAVVGMFHEWTPQRMMGPASRLPGFLEQRPSHLTVPCLTFGGFPVTKFGRVCYSNSNWIICLRKLYKV